MNAISRDIYDFTDLLPPDFQGWNGLSPWFEYLINEVKPTTIIEVGTWKGQSAINMGNVVKKLGLETTLYCVDTWLGALEFWTGDESKTPERNLLLKNGYPSIYYQFLSNVIHSGLQDIIVPFPNTSLIGARYFKKIGQSADLIYIDASHEYEDILADIIAYFPILKVGGIMFGDDYISYWSGVVRAVNEFSQMNNLKLQITPSDNFWIIQKTQ